MATLSATQTIQVKTEQRTWRATLETPKGGNYSLSIHREKRMLDASGQTLGEPVVLEPIELPFAAIKDETVTVEGQTLSVEQLAASLAAYFDQKAAQLAAS